MSFKSGFESTERKSQFNTAGGSVCRLKLHEKVSIQPRYEGRHRGVGDE